jgi:UvrD-like helicase C-terminal domain
VASRYLVGARAIAEKERLAGRIVPRDVGPKRDATSDVIGGPPTSRANERACWWPRFTRPATSHRAGVRAQRLRDALAPLIEARYPDGPIRLADLEQLVAAAREHRGELRHFVGELVLDPPQSSADLAGPPHLDEDYLVLSTIHSAKGLEWHAVHVIALYDGNVPADMSAGSKEASTKSDGCSTSR